MLTYWKVCVDGCVYLYRVDDDKDMAEFYSVVTYGHPSSMTLICTQI